MFRSRSAEKVQSNKYHAMASTRDILPYIRAGIFTGGESGAMGGPTRYDRRPRLSTKRNPKLELRVVSPDADSAVAPESGADTEVLTARQRQQLIGDLAVKHGISVDRAQMLIDRFGNARRRLDCAAHELQDWRH